MKKALLIGINYKGSDSELFGCVNDVTNIYKVLIDQYGYKDQDITMLVEDDPSKKDPTYENIIKEFHHLQQHKDAEQYFIHYSGHGSQVLDTSGDESDKLDECIIPLDYDKKGVITDDLLSNLLKRFDSSKKIVCIIDACNSGSMLDLKYELNCLTNYIKPEKKTEYNHNNWSYEFRLQQKHMYGSFGNILLLSGCKDDQTSSDAYITNSYQGALTFYLLRILKANNYNIKLRYLLKDIHILLRKSRFSQKPVMSSSKMFDLDQYFDI